MELNTPQLPSPRSSFRIPEPLPSTSGQHKEPQPVSLGVTDMPPNSSPLDVSLVLPYESEVDSPSSVHFSQPLGSLPEVEAVELDHMGLLYRGNNNHRHLHQKGEDKKCKKMSSNEDIPNNLLKVIECKQGAVRAVRFNVDGEYCMTCGSDKSIKLWNPYKGTLLHTYSGHGYEVLDAKGSTDNSLICSCGMDKSVMVWNVSTGECMRKFRGHAARVNCLDFNEESTVVLSGSLDGTVKIWDLRSRKLDPIQVLDEAKDSVMCVQVSGDMILTASLDCYTRIYDLRKGLLLSNCIGEGVTCATFSGDVQCVLASSMDSTLRLMDKDTGELLSHYTGHNTKDYKVECCFTSSDTHVISGSQDGYVYCWNLIQASITTRLEHKGSNVVHSLSHHPTKPHLLTATMGQIWLWSANAE